MFLWLTHVNQKPDQPFRPLFHQGSLVPLEMVSVIYEGELGSSRTRLCGDVCADDTSNEKSKAVSLLSSAHCRYRSTAQGRWSCWGLFLSATTITFIPPEYSLQLNFLFYSETLLTRSALIYLGRKMLFNFLYSSHCCPSLPKERSHPSTPPTLCSYPSPPLLCLGYLTGPFLSQPNSLILRKQLGLSCSMSLTWV